VHDRLSKETEGQDAATSVEQVVHGRIKKKKKLLRGRKEGISGCESIRLR